MNEPQDYVVTMRVRVKVYADDADDAIRQARSHRNWWDWFVDGDGTVMTASEFERTHGARFFHRPMREGIERMEGVGE